mmetsp:Transcript_11764/g.26162  ORF Transcript_11764/g.26162 Transcript_11764/m.26162 type:complete len:1238 (-) Transcript_11764:40-3753(-)
MKSLGTAMQGSGSFHDGEGGVAGIHESRPVAENNTGPDESMLSQSLGAYPSFNLPLLQRRVSDPTNQIYHAGYLLKRSNNPVEQWPENSTATTPRQEEGKLPQTQASSSSTLYELDRTSSDEMEEKTPLTTNDEHADLFVADWGEELMANAPTLQPASELFAGDDGVEDQHDFPTTEPIFSLSFRASNNLSSPVQPQSTTSPSQPLHQQNQPNLEKPENRHELFLNMAADLFGMTRPFPRPSDVKPSQSVSKLEKQPLVAVAETVEKDQISEAGKSKQKKAANKNPRSTPIKMPLTPRKSPANTLPENQAPSSNGSNPYHRSQSERMIPLQSGQPVDFRDDKDHVWRSKYCILQDGVLYFYRNQEDGESPEAKTERSNVIHNTSHIQKNSNHATIDHLTYESLARSPIPRRQIVKVPSSPSEAPNHLWEKRVRVEAIGAVRSAEAKYGPNSFALLSPPKDDDNDKQSSANGKDVSIENADDKLILMARNASERGDWIFQFHRSIAIFVKNMINEMAPVATNSVGTPNLRSGYAGNSFRATNSGPRYHEMPQPRRDNHDSVFTPPRRLKLTSGGTPSSHSDWAQQKESAQRETSTATTASLSPASTLLSSPTINDNFASFKGTSATPPTPPSEAAAASTAAEISDQRMSQGASARQVSPTIDFVERDDVSPELSAPSSLHPETERPPPPKPSGGKYVPPALRRLQQREQQQQQSVNPPQPPKVFRKYVPPSLRERNNKSESTIGQPKKEVKKYVPPSKRNRGENPFPPVGPSGISSLDKKQPAATQQESPERVNPDPQDVKPFQMGGCADPRIVKGSVLDAVFVPRKASKLERKLRAAPYRKLHRVSDSISWDVGAVSECGVRDANEDAYLISENLLESFDDAKASSLNSFSARHPPGLFCIFDGHAGDQAARFATERLTSFLEKEAIASALDEDGGAFTERLVRGALSQLDTEFCKVCVEGGREWESGATALVAALIDSRLVVGNLGDARAVASRSVDACDVSGLEKEGWSSLPDGDHSGSRSCLWKEVSTSHHPSRDDERTRIEAAGGWITFESEIYVDRLKRVDLQDGAVVDILQRCFADRYAASPKAAAPQRVVESSRVCGELAVSRSIGDKDFKAAFNKRTEGGTAGAWDSPCYLSFPPDHSRSFQGDLITSVPDFQTLPIGEANAHEEFFLLACDGLWDVMDSDDAVRVTRELLFDLKWPASEAAHRLAEIAVHLGSADNVTVIVVAMGPVD